MVQNQNIHFTAISPPIASIKEHRIQNANTHHTKRGRFLSAKRSGQKRHIHFDPKAKTRVSKKKVHALTARTNVLFGSEFYAPHAAIRIINRRMKIRGRYQP